MKVLIIFLLYSFLLSCIFSNEESKDSQILHDDPKSIENLEKTISIILKEFNLDKQADISHEEFTKIFYRLMTMDMPEENKTANEENDVFFKDLITKILLNAPERIKVTEIITLVSPEKIESVFNELLGEVDLKDFFNKEGSKITGEAEEQQTKKTSQESSSKEIPSKDSNEHIEL